MLELVENRVVTIILNFTKIGEDGNYTREFIKRD